MIVFQGNFEIFSCPEVAEFWKRCYDTRKTRVKMRL